jgi:hypothetical protein
MSADEGACLLLVKHLVPDSSRYFVLEQGDARVTGTLTVIGAVLTLK